MISSVEIMQIESVGNYKEELSKLLREVVEDGASIGFLPPLQLKDAENYWEKLVSREIILYIAKVNNQIAGSVQLHLCTKQNGYHRAEIAKLMTHPNYRRNGIGRKLMMKAEEKAKSEGRTLLVLDTREGDSSNLLYNSLGYSPVGKIPYYAKSADGEFHSTVFYYKSI